MNTAAGPTNEPKIEEGEGYLFTVLKPVRIDEQGSFDAIDLDIFLGIDFLIMLLETDCILLRMAWTARWE